MDFDHFPECYTQVMLAPRMRAGQRLFLPCKWMISLEGNLSSTEKSRVMSQKPSWATSNLVLSTWWVDLRHHVWMHMKITKDGISHSFSFSKVELLLDLNT